MLMTIGTDPSRQPSFIETEPVWLRSDRVDIDVPYTEFEKSVAEVVQETGFRYAGFVTKADNGNVTSFTRTGYPRTKYGVDSYDDHKRSLDLLADKLDSVFEREYKEEVIRTVFGLNEGNGNQALRHDIQEVEEALPNSEVTPAEVFATHPTEQSVSIYNAPAVVVKTPLNMLNQIYRLGHNLKQERFTIENFEVYLAYIVETEYCTESDFPPQALTLFDRKFSGDDVLMVMELGGMGVGATMMIADEIEHRSRRLGTVSLMTRSRSETKPPDEHIEKVGWFMNRVFSGRDLIAITERGHLEVEETLSIIEDIEERQRDHRWSYRQWTYPPGN